MLRFASRPPMLVPIMISFLLGSVDCRAQSAAAETLSPPEIYPQPLYPDCTSRTHCSFDGPLAINACLYFSEPIPGQFITASQKAAGGS